MKKARRARYFWAALGLALFFVQLLIRQSGTYLQCENGFLEAIVCSEQITKEQAKPRWWRHLLAEILKIFTPLL